MRQILLFLAPLCLVACSIKSTEDRDPQSTAKFLTGHNATLSLKQMAGSMATIDQVRTIASDYVYDGSKQEFQSMSVAGYHPYLQDGVDQKGLRTLTLNAGSNGSALFIFDKNSRVREAMPLNSPSAPQFRIIDGKTRSGR